MTKNLKNIESLLKTFAKDFSDKKEYNAYKHGLRCFNAKSQISMGLTGTQQMHVIGQSEDAIYYLEEHVPDSPPQNPDEPVKINRVTKSFDFERDYRCCVLIDELIKCIINTRKYSIVDELRGKQCSYATFDTIEFPAVVTSKAGIHRFSMTA